MGSILSVFLCVCLSVFFLPWVGFSRMNCFFYIWYEFSCFEKIIKHTNPSSKAGSPRNLHTFKIRKQDKNGWYLALVLSVRWVKWSCRLQDISPNFSQCLEQAARAQTKTTRLLESIGVLVPTVCARWSPLVTSLWLYTNICRSTQLQIYVTFWQEVGGIWRVFTLCVFNWIKNSFTFRPSFGRRRHLVDCDVCDLKR